LGLVEVFFEFGVHKIRSRSVELGRVRSRLVGVEGGERWSNGESEDLGFGVHGL
jgi:hypothetical protein